MTDAQEAALRHRPDRQELPQRDHAGQFIFRTRSSSRWRWSSSSSPATTSTGTSTGSTRHRWAWSTSASTRQPAAHYEGEADERQPLLQGTDRHRVPIPFAGSEWGSSRASPTAPTSTCRPRKARGQVDLVFFDQDQRGAVRALRHRAHGHLSELMTFLGGRTPGREVQRGVTSASCSLDPRLAPQRWPCRRRHNGADLPHPEPRQPSRAGNWNIDYDDSQNVGKRYRRQDEIGAVHHLQIGGAPWTTRP